MCLPARWVCVVLAAALSACAGGGSGVAPSTQQAKSAAKTTKATFTIQWTNARAPLSVRQRDLISPSAASVTVSINGTLSTIANRNGAPAQSIALVAPVGQDQFQFQVYDLPNGTGTLLGTATVSQLIVDGAANTVTAVIQAVCSATNVQVLSVSPIAKTSSAQSGIYAPSLQSIELVGPQPATLQVGPEDADGNVIIAGTAGTVQSGISSQATVTPINGTQISLVPAEVAPTAPAATLTVAAPSCPTTTVAVKSSPAIYLEALSGGIDTVTLYDWYGSQLAYQVYGGLQIIGFDSRADQLVIYSPANGNVYDVVQNLASYTYLYTLPTNAHVTWSNYAHSVFGAYGTTSTSYFTYNGGIQTVASPTTGANVAVSSATLSTNPNVFATNGTTIYGFSMATLTQTASYAAQFSTVGLATDDTAANGPQIGAVFGLSGTSGTYQFTDYPQSLDTFCCSFNLGGFSQSAATDTGAYNTIYSFLTNGDVASYTWPDEFSHSILPTGSFGTPVAIVVASTNER